MRTSAIACALALAIPASAAAAEPQSGAVGPETPQAQKVTWDGDIYGPLGLYNDAMWVNGGTNVAGNETCVNPWCDTFTLTVRPGGRDIRITVAGAASDISMDISAPDGTRETIGGLDNPASSVSYVWGAIPGTWTIRVYGNPDALLAFPYTGTAEINLENDPPFEQ